MTLLGTLCDDFLIWQFAIQNHKTEYIETSVHSGKNIRQAFHMLAEHLIFSHGIFQPGREVRLVCYWIFISFEVFCAGQHY